MSIFGKIGKAIGKVAGKAIVGTVAKTLVGSVPILGGVVSAVGAVKSHLRPPTLANTANVSARTGVPAFGQPGIMASRAFQRIAARRTAHPSRRAFPTQRRRAAVAPSPRRAVRRAGGVSAKQRAARARFARWARKGRIRKGQRLR